MRMIVKVLMVVILFGNFAFGKDTVNINFKGLNIRDFVKMVAKIRNENILIGSKLSGSINFISVKPIPKKSLMTLLNHVLETKGFTLVRTGHRYLKVVKIADAGRSGLPVNTTKDTFQIVTEIIEVDGMNVDLLVTKLRHLVTKNSKITTSKETNALIVTDYPDKIKSIKKIINLLSSKSQLRTQVIRLEHIKADVIGPDILKITKNLFDPKIAKNNLDIIVNTKTNTITLVGRQSQIDRVAELINDADNQDDKSSIVMEVIPINNSSAEEMIKILEKFYATKGKNVLYQPSFMNDKELNSVIVRARKRDIDDIFDVIKKLDVPKPQVYVKARIIEISDEKASDIGIKYGLTGGKVTSNGLMTMSANMGGQSIAVDSTLMSYIDIDTNLKEFFALGATLSLLQRDGAAEVLSEPSLLCLNNKESEIYVGNTQSVVTTTAKGTTSTSDTTNSYKREDIGLTLKIKPRLSSDNKVTLEVSTIIEDVLGSDSNGQPITTKRTVKTTAIVNDAELVMLGGLNKTKETTDISKVPLLGDIPVLGALFRNTNKTMSKTSLAIMLTPYIIDENRNISKLRNDLNMLALAQDDYTTKAMAILDNGDVREVRLEKRKTKNPDNISSPTAKKSFIKRSSPQAQQRYYNKPKTYKKPKKTKKYYKQQPKGKYNIYVGKYYSFSEIKEIRNDKKVNTNTDMKLNYDGKNIFEVSVGPYRTMTKTKKILKYIKEKYNEDAYIKDKIK